jgi:hypothetical protein
MGQLERMFYFNNNQEKCCLNIIMAIELYGIPNIINKNNSLFIAFEKVDCQNLFVIKNGELVGALVFYRNKPENIDLIHIAIDEKYSSTGEYVDNILFLKMINELKKIARMIKGIKTITIKYIDNEQNTSSSLGLVLKVIKHQSIPSDDPIT